MSKDYLLESYNFDLPEEQIAQNPVQERDSSRLLIYSKEDNSIKDKKFSDIVEIIKDYSLKPLFIANNSKVLPARMHALSPYGGKREMLLLTPLALLEIIEENGENHAIAEVLLKPSKNANIGDIWEFSGNLKVKILEKFDYGNTKVEFIYKDDLADIFNTYGQLPLPPYIKRAKKPETKEEKEQSNQDILRYQTTYARDEKLGSVAAPTAGLHFTNELRENLIKNGCQWEEVTLHVGYGTFTPVRSTDIREHAMHAEYFELSSQTSKAILEAKKIGRPIIAVGTTSSRVLEGAYRLWQENVENTDKSYLPKDGMRASTKIFIYPNARKDLGFSKEFDIIDALITNFHLPESSLLMLVSALCGREEILEIYKHAVEKGYRFFSYGDAMFIK